MSGINLETYSNSDLHRDFQLKEGTSVDTAVPTDITGMSLLVEIRDDKNVLVLHMNSADATTLVILDPTLGKFGFRIGGELLPTDRRYLKYDVLLINGGYTRRLWGGLIKMKLGTTVDI